MEKISFNLKEKKVVSLYNKVFFDVGANDGHTSIPVAQQHPNTLVYSFEPVPELVNKISRIILSFYYFFCQLADSSS